MARQLCEDKSRNMVSSSSAGFCYSDVSSTNPTIQTHMGNSISGFESNPEIFNLTTGMEMIGFSRNIQQQHDAGDDDGDGDGDDDQFNNHDHHLMVGPDSSSWQRQQQQQEQNRLLVDDSSFRCVFPCEGNERPSQGLSLSLSSANPSSIGLQSFELRHTTNHQEELSFLNSNSSSSRDGFFVKTAPSLHHHQQQQHMMQGDFMAKSNLHHHQHQQGQFQLRNSKYLAAAQELLNEFCSLETKQLTDQQKIQKKKNWDDEINDNNSSSSSRKQSLYSLEFMELQKRKTKLLSMLEAIDRRYRHYCDQMKAVVSSFEAVAGAGTAVVYLSLASKAMSRHFRCLKDGILAQIYATKKAMGEKDLVAPGTTRGETPRLKVLEQTLRQQRAIQQMHMMESHPWRPQRGLPERSVSVLRAWLFEHFLHPYPSDVDKHILARQTGLSRSQVSNWFINARVRLWKPMIEEMYTEEAKDEENNNSDNGMTDLEDSINTACRLNNNPTTDQKPTPDQLLRIDSECLSSIISNSDKNDHTNSINIKSHNLQNNFGSAASFGAVELDFSSYNHHSAGGVSYVNHNQNFNGGGVSLTLGLQQHGDSGGSLAFSPASQSSLFYPRDHIDDCQPVQYSILDASEAQNLPYRNLMGAQLLHDLAG